MEHSDSELFEIVSNDGETEPEYGVYTYDGVTVVIAANTVSVDMTGQPDVLIRRVEQMD